MILGPKIFVCCYVVFFPLGPQLSYGVFFFKELHVVIAAFRIIFHLCIEPPVVVSINKCNSLWELGIDLLESAIEPFGVLFAKMPVVLFTMNLGFFFTIRHGALFWADVMGGFFPIQVMLNMKN